MTDPNADLRALLDLMGGLEVRSAEHPEDRRQRHRAETKAFWLISAITGFAALVVLFSFFRPLPEKRADWAAVQVCSNWFWVGPSDLPLSDPSDLLFCRWLCFR